MSRRWMKTRNSKPDSQELKWRENDWLLVDGKKVLARTYASHQGPHTGQWLWALTAWDGHAGVTDTFEEAKAAVKARLESLRKARRHQWLLSRRINGSTKRKVGGPAEQAATSFRPERHLEPPPEAGREIASDRRLSPTLAGRVSAAPSNE